MEKRTKYKGTWQCHNYHIGGKIKVYIPDNLDSSFDTKVKISASDLVGKYFLTKAFVLSYPNKTTIEMKLNGICVNNWTLDIAAVVEVVDDKLIGTFESRDTGKILLSKNKNEEKRLIRSDRLNSIAL